MFFERMHTTFAHVLQRGEMKADKVAELRNAATVLAHLNDGVTSYRAFKPENVLLIDD